MNAVSVDPGLDGGICTKDGNVVSTPIVKIEVKAATYIYCRDDSGKKIVIKSGPNKGELKRKIRKAAEYKTELDVHSIIDLFTGHDVLVIEAPGNSVGNSASTTATTHYNIGVLHTCAKIVGCKIVVVTASKWKGDLKLTYKHLGLSKDDIKKGKHKLLCTERAEELSGMRFRGLQGGIKDGQAEAWLIGYWYKNYVIK